ncbi:hypothetical protein GCM10020254_52030 [Streptomyces goshikiensis]
MSSRTFSGLTSRCTTPAACAAASASATSATIATAASRGEPPLAVEARTEVRTAHQVHDEGEVVAVHDEIADGDHMRVFQPEQRAALLDEPPHQLLVGREVLAQEFDGDGAVRPSPSHTVPALPRPRIWCAVYRLPIFRATTAPSAAGVPHQSYAAEWGL